MYFAYVQTEVSKPESVQRQQEIKNKVQEVIK